MFAAMRRTGVSTLALIDWAQGLPSNPPGAFDVPEASSAGVMVTRSPGTVFTENRAGVTWQRSIHVKADCPSQQPIRSEYRLKRGSYIF
ncbi:hypothetical protein EYF80_008797 [Liparis tanakae]|uniref:Uncharacterized protein n=1 Tax=Liparis tanakae TaxID=230148 RepID=A0A4Z2ITJ4_9TELE|nr:hypothetical protein EYF80_008797 [Liparis tanakae]